MVFLKRGSDIERKTDGASVTEAKVQAFVTISGLFFAFL
jgi:hypothetical protein